MSQTKPFFIPQKEFDLINQMNEELIDEIVGQSVDIYKVNVERTEDNVYGESTAKYYDIGFRVNCLINYNEPEIIQDEFGADLNSSIEMFFQRENKWLFNKSHIRKLRSLILLILTIRKHLYLNKRLMVMLEKTKMSMVKENIPTHLNQMVIYKWNK